MHLAPGLEPASAHPLASNAAGAASFQSSWQSMLASLGAETSAGETGKTQAGGGQSASTSPSPKNMPLPLPSDPGANASQASVARFKLDPGAVFQQQANAAGADQEDAASGSTPGTSLESSENSGKNVKHASGPQNGPENGSAKKPAANTLNAQITQAAIAVAAPVPLAAQLPQPASTSAGHHAQSFLTDASLAAGHRAASGLTNGIAAPIAAQGTQTNGVATASTNGASSAGSLEGNAAGIAKSASSGSEAHGLPGLAHDLAHDPSAAPSSGVADAASNAASDAASAASASAGSLSAAQTIAAGDKRIAEQAGPRPAHGAADATSASLQGHTLAVQAIGAGGDPSSAFARDAAAQQAQAGALPPGSVSGTGSSPGAHETFAALDADAAHGPAWLHAGAQSAEAGFEDPALGWVSVRADMAAGGVHAAVVPGTADAAQALGAHMAGLNSYLSENRAAVQTLTLASPGGGQGFNQGSNQGTTGQGTGQGSTQDSGYRDGSGQQSGPQAGMPPVPGASQSFVQTRGATGESAPVSSRVGTSISLIA